MSSERFSNYLVKISQSPLLSADEEYELGKNIQEWEQLVKAAKSGDTQESEEAKRQLADPTRQKLSDEARHKLTEANLRLVVSIAREYENAYLSLEELTGEGNTGLLQAVKRFNPVKFNNRFSTYATYWIKQAIRKAAYRSKLIRVPVRRATQLGKIQEAKSYNEAAGADQDFAEIAKETELNADEVKDCLVSRTQLLSLDYKLYGNSDETFSSTIADESGDPLEPFMQIEDRTQLLKAINEVLEEKQKQILLRRFGIVNDRIETLEELSATWRVSRERIRQIANQAIERLQRHFQIPVRPNRRAKKTEEPTSVAKKGKRIAATMANAKKTLALS